VLPEHALRRPMQQQQQTQQTRRHLGNKGCMSPNQAEQ
jgi:hypothetical protein